MRKDKGVLILNLESGHRNSVNEQY